MKKILILGLLLILMIPINVKADVGSVSLTCSKVKLKPGDTFTCTVNINATSNITDVEIPIVLDNNISIVGNTIALTNSVWNGNDVSDNRIGTNFNASLNGNIVLGTLTFEVSNNATIGNTTIGLEDIIFFNDVTEYSIANYSKTVNIRNPYIESATCVVDNNYLFISRINAGQSITTFINALDSNGDITILDSNSNVVSSNNIRTGYSLKVDYGSYFDIYKLSVLGDVDGDGAITRTDAVSVANNIIDNTSFSDDEYNLAADINDDGNIKMNDVMRIIKSDIPSGGV